MIQSSNSLRYVLLRLPDLLELRFLFHFAGGNMSCLDSVHRGLLMVRLTVGGF